MNAAGCRWEEEVINAIRSRRWPTRVEPELRAHVAACPACSDMAAVVTALLDAEDAGPTGPPAGPPPSAIVWWRAQVAAREEAARAASRPMWVALLVALACGALAGAALLRFAVPALAVFADASASAAGNLLPSFDGIVVADAALAALASRSMQLAAAAWLVLAPVAVYFAIARD